MCKIYVYVNTSCNPKVNEQDPSNEFPKKSPKISPMKETIQKNTLAFRFVYPVSTRQPFGL